MKKLKLLTNIEESYDELRYKTSWPTKKQLVKSAVIVMIASVIIALIIFLMDQVVDGMFFVPFPAMKPRLRRFLMHKSRILILASTFFRC